MNLSGKKTPDYNHLHGNRAVLFRLFDVALNDIRNLITWDLPALRGVGIENIGSEILLEFIGFIVGKVRSQGKDVNEVVVIIDEIFNHEKDLFKK